MTVVALYDGPQTLPLPEMYGKNLIFKTGGVDGCNCAETLELIAAGEIDTTRRSLPIALNSRTLRKHTAFLRTSWTALLKSQWNRKRI